MLKFLKYFLIYYNILTRGIAAFSPAFFPKPKPSTRWQPLPCSSTASTQKDRQPRPMSFQNPFKVLLTTLSQSVQTGGQVSNHGQNPLSMLLRRKSATLGKLPPFKSQLTQKQAPSQPCLSFSGSEPLTQHLNNSSNFNCNPIFPPEMVKKPSF